MAQLLPEGRSRSYSAADEFWLINIHDLGNQVRSLRKTRGLTQPELARRMGMSQPAISELESGRSLPNLRTLRRLAEALSMEFVFGFRTSFGVSPRVLPSGGVDTALSLLDGLARPIVAGTVDFSVVDDHLRDQLYDLSRLRREAVTHHPWAQLLLAWMGSEQGWENSLITGLLDAAESAFERTSDRVGRSYAAFARGQFALSNGDLTEAGRFWEKARSMLPEPDAADPIDELALANQTYEAFARGDLPDAHRRAFHGLALAKLRGNRRVEGLAFLALGFVALHRGEFREAEDALSRADEVYGEVEEEDFYAEYSLTRATRAALWSLRGQTDQAEAEFDEALRIAHQWHEYIVRAVRVEMTAEREPRRAEKEARRILSEFPNRQDSWWAIWAVRGLGVALCHMGRMEESELILHRVSEECRYPIERGRSLLALGETLLARNRLRDAEAVLAQAVRIFESHRTPYLLVRAYVRTAETRPGWRARRLSAARKHCTDDAVYQELFRPAEGRLVLDFGPPAHALVDGTTVKFKTKKAGELLFALASESPLPAVELAERLWPGVPRSKASARLRDALWKAKHALGTEGWRLERDRDSRLRFISTGVRIESS
jgi:transcriptional regulator with XRE-family HTH domain/tetratricopeptide (TPR) repeat protein